MRKILAFGLVLALFSCSQEDNSTINTVDDKDTKTIDTTIGYESPYDEYFSTNIVYKITNSTNFTFSLKPYFGLAYYDGAIDYKYHGWDFENPSNDPLSAAFNLGANQREYGNYVSPSNAIVVSPFGDLTDTAGNVPCLDAPYTMLFDITDHTSLYEYSYIHKMGKLYFIEFEIFDGNFSVHSNKIKTNFPAGIKSTGYLPQPWESLGINDSYFGDELIYNSKTNEICLTIDKDSGAQDKAQFVYQGRKYQVGIRTNQTTVEIYLELLD